MAEQNDPVVLRYKPKHPGEGYRDVPQRDLTQSDVDALVGAALRDVLHPDGDPIYVPVADKKVKPKAPPKPHAEAPATAAELLPPTVTVEPPDQPPTGVSPKGGE